jgi:hypothetical protein
MSALFKIRWLGRLWWLIPVILAIQDLEIWRITVQGQPRQKALKTLISFNKIWVW